jgi:predicted nucleic acid-binding Zn ribbon protein
MAEMSPGTALRDLQKAQAGMKKARELLKQARLNPRAPEATFAAGWESLTQAHRLMAAIPLVAIDDNVLTKQLAVGRYATALLVRLRRLKRRGTIDSADMDDVDDLGDDDTED